jgi:hypothetical protein
MALQLVEKSIMINASTEKIWHTITRDECNSIWLSAFGKGTRAQADWHQGSIAIFIDKSQTGLITKIRESRPFEEILMQNIDMIKNGQEGMESRAAHNK